MKNKIKSCVSFFLIVIMISVFMLPALAADDNVIGSKITFFVSPNWFMGHSVLSWYSSYKQLTSFVFLQDYYDVNHPVSFMRVRPRIYNTNGVLVKDGGYMVNGASTSYAYATVTYLNPPMTYYYAQGLVAAKDTSGTYMEYNTSKTDKIFTS